MHILRRNCKNCVHWIKKAIWNVNQTMKISTFSIRSSPSLKKDCMRNWRLWCDMYTKWLCWKLLYYFRWNNIYFLFYPSNLPVKKLQYLTLSQSFECPFHSWMLKMQRFRKSTSEIIIKLLSNIQKNLQHTFLFLFPIKNELVKINGDDDDD